MKKKYLILLSLSYLLSYYSNAQSVSITLATLSSNPIGSIENNGKTIAKFTFSESSGSIVKSSVFGLPNVTNKCKFAIY